MSRRSIHNEHGGILVMSAVMIPVFLLLTALVVDVGNWFTHKRQLQNRADAAAFAAGVEYAQNWKACVQNGDATLKLTTAQEIADVARQYAGDPEAADYAGGSLPTLRNTEIANQANLDVVINSSNPDYADDTDYTDGDTPVDVANPCYIHSGDDISPGGGHWTDVRVKERDLPSFFVGLGLARNGARARVEIRPALSGNRFLPLAIPDNLILKVQVRYYDECRDDLIATQDLAPLPDADQAAWKSTGGGALWGMPSVGDASVGDPNRSFDLVFPSYGGCGQDYLPIGVEVRIASRAEVDLNQSCSTLASSKFADCFRRLSQIRVWNDGNPDSQPRVKDVVLTGGCPFSDAYFGTLPIGATDCSYGATVAVDWGTRDNDPLDDVLANFEVEVNGVALDPPAGSPTGVWSTAGTPLNASEGPNPVAVTVSWKDNDPNHSWAGDPCTNGNNTPCKWGPTTEQAHQAFGGTSATSGAVELVRSSQTAFVSGLPGPSFDNLADGGVTLPVFPTIGTRAVLKAGVLTTLRTEDSQGSQLLRCDPAVSQGQEFKLFENGCEPWYAKNPFTNGPWWITGTQSCPDQGLWFGTGTMPAPYGENSSTNPWRCVPLAPGSSNGQTGNWMSVGTQNCNDIKNNSCGDIACNFEGNYDGKPGQPNGWVQNGGDSGDPRVISLFIIPYQALKGVTGANEEAPVLGFASFYVMDWTGSNSAKSDQCPDPDFGGVTLTPPLAGTVRGVFVETVEYEPGPVDPNATCVEGQLTPCRVTLVR